MSITQLHCDELESHEKSVLFQFAFVGLFYQSPDQNNYYRTLLNVHAMLAFPGHALRSIFIFSVSRYKAEVQNKNAPGS